nr:MAG TPA: hypothetical protein [Caudoviricetes sp.]
MPLKKIRQLKNKSNIHLEKQIILLNEQSINNPCYI